MVAESIVRFRQRLAAEAQRCYWKQDIAGILQILDTIERKMQGTTELAALGQLETSAVHVILVAAEAHLDELEFESCFCLCQDAKNVIEHSARRFIDAGETPPPNSMVRIGLLDQLADAKWKMPSAAHIDRVMHSAEMFQQYARLVPSILSRIPTMGYPSSEIERTHHNMLWAGVMLYKQAMRFSPSTCADIGLAMDCVLPGVLKDEDRPYFWDVQIARHVLTGQPDRSKLTYYYTRRRHCLDTYVKDPPDHTAYDRSAANELEYLLGRRFGDRDCC